MRQYIFTEIIGVYIEIMPMVVSASKFLEFDEYFQSSRVGCVTKFHKVSEWKASGSWFVDSGLDHHMLAETVKLK